MTRGSEIVVAAVLNPDLQPPPPPQDIQYSMPTPKVKITQSPLKIH